MANYCIFCGEEIPEHRAACGLCTTIMDSLPPERQKKMKRVLEDEEAMAKLRTALREFKLQMRIALEPVAASIIAFIDTVFAVTEEADDGTA